MCVCVFEEMVNFMKSFNFSNIYSLIDPENSGKILARFGRSLNMVAFIKILKKFDKVSILPIQLEQLGPNPSLLHFYHLNATHQVWIRIGHILYELSFFRLPLSGTNTAPH